MPARRIGPASEGGLRLVIFDLDGTLIRTDGAGRRALVRAWERCFGVPVQLEGRWFAGRSDPAIFEEVARLTGLSDHYARRADELIRTYLRLLEDELHARPGALLPGVGTLLERLSRRSGWGLALGTGNLEAGARLKLAAFDLNRFFPVGGFGGDGHDRVAILQAAVRRAREHFGAPVGAAVAVGDTPLDVEAARRLGLRAVAVGTGPYSLEELQAAGPDAALADLSDAEGVVGLLSRLLGEPPSG